MTKMQFYERIEQLLKERGWTKHRLAKESNIPKSTIYNMMANKNEPKLETIIKIVKAFNISFDEFIMMKPHDIVSLSEKEMELIEITHKLSNSEIDRVISYAICLAESSKK